MADIFISYSRKDAQLTQELAGYLQSQGYTTWWDMSLSPGEAWNFAIQRQLEEAKAVIVIWSKGSVTSKWVLAEAEHARRQEKLITLRAPSLDPYRIPTLFASLYALPLTERAQILEALARCGIEPPGTAKGLSEKACIAKAIVDYDREDFRELIKLSGLDPSRHLRFWDWSNLNFEGADLRGYDFSGALLRNCQFRGARILGARFDKADVKGSNLRAALDWYEYVAGWTPDPDAPTDEHLAVGAVFQDAPFGPEMVVVPPGRFLMGSKHGEGETDERPQHEVIIPHALAVGRCPVTFEEWDYAQIDAEWLEITERKPRKSADHGWGRDRRPVIFVSWEDAQAYARWLSRKIGQLYRLLSEAEWEYACRAGCEGTYCFGNNEAELGDYAWYGSNSRGRTQPVGRKKQNEFGVHDMHGNVSEWCEDLWHNSYESKPANLKETGEAWTTGESNRRVLRGGSWNYNPGALRSASRSFYGLRYKNRFRGFRVARTLFS